MPRASTGVNAIGKVMATTTFRASGCVNGEPPHRDLQIPRGTIGDLIQEDPDGDVDFVRVQFKHPEGHIVADVWRGLEAAII